MTAKGDDDPDEIPGALRLRRDLPPMPTRIARLPRDPRGFPIPFFVLRDPLDFRVVAPGALTACVKGGRCWVCGDVLGRNVSFVAGPMCAVNRTSSEPPSHRECAEWSVRACPFLSRPKMRRNERGLPETRHVAGVQLKRNPGVVLVWTCRGYKPFRVNASPNGAGAGVLFEMGEPTDLAFFAEGRPATRAEIESSIAGGLPSLAAMCETEATPTLRELARRELAERLAWVRARLPAAEVPA